MIAPETFDAIMADVIGGSPVRSAIAAASVAPGTFYRAIDADPQLAERYARAKGAGLEAMADETLAIADDEAIPEGSRRIRVDTRKWLLSKLAPKRYGERLATEVSGPDGGPVKVGVTVEFVGATAGSVPVFVAGKG